MASFDFISVALNESTTFVFGSWICITNGSDGLNSYLANSRGAEASAASTTALKSIYSTKSRSPSRSFELTEIKINVLRFPVEY